MRITYLPKNFSKACDYTILNNVLHEFRVKYEQILSNWKESREKYKMSFDDLAKHYGFSRATYYRKRKIFNRLVAKRKIIYRKARIFRCAKLAENRFAIGLMS